jgi:hypothetical protein
MCATGDLAEEGSVMLALIRRWFDPFSRSTEAVEWLRENRNPSALATNRFQRSENAIRFVELLYKAGAEAVAIPTKCLFRERWRVKAEGGPYCETLLVRLPKDVGKRRAVWDLCRKELAEQAAENAPPAEAPPKQDVVWLWWD